MVFVLIFSGITITLSRALNAALRPRTISGEFSLTLSHFMAHFYVPWQPPFSLAGEEGEEEEKEEEEGEEEEGGWLVGCWTGLSGLETDSLVFSNTNTGDIMAIT